MENVAAAVAAEVTTALRERIARLLTSRARARAGVCRRMPTSSRERVGHSLPLSRPYTTACTRSHCSAAAASERRMPIPMQKGLPNPSRS